MWEYDSCHLCDNLRVKILARCLMPNHPISEHNKSSEGAVLNQARVQLIGLLPLIMRRHDLVRTWDLDFRSVTRTSTRRSVP